jgi:hypothetical protein
LRLKAPGLIRINETSRLMGSYPGCGSRRLAPERRRDSADERLRAIRRSEAACLLRGT